MGVLNFFSLRHGFSSLEFLLTAIPVLLLGLSSYEITRWYNTRHVLNLALVEAARAASVYHAKPEEIENSFEEALTPLFTPADNPTQRRQRYFKNIESTTQSPAWQIKWRSPTHAHFIDFHRDDLAIAEATGLYAIDNNYQKEQHNRKGLGALSQENIYEANTLSLSLTYPYEPIVPGMKFLFKQIRHFYTEPYSHNLLSHGFLPIQHDISISMQSHPVQWTSSDKVITSYPNSAITRTHQIVATDNTCYGIWCHTDTNTAKSPTIPRTEPPVDLPNTPPSSPPSHNNGGYSPPIEQEPPIVESSISDSRQHPQCGISLCCS